MSGEEADPMQSTAERRRPQMNEISGRIVVRETGIGIPALVVTAFDLDPGTKPEELVATDSGSDGVATLTAARKGFPGRRLGSTLTDESGGFRVTYEDDDFRLPGGEQNRKEIRPHLFLTVFAPEEPDSAAKPHILFASQAIRQNAGRTEQYFVRLSAEDLAKASIALPTTPIDEVEEPKRLVERLATADLRLETIDDAFRNLDKKRVKQTRKTADAFRGALKAQLRESLSRVSAKRIDPATFVKDDESVFDKSIAVIRRGIEKVINSDDPAVKAPARRLVALTEAEKSKVAGALDQNGAISADELENILRDGQEGRRTTTFVLREDPLLEICRETSKEEARCAAVLELEGVAGGSSGGNGAAEANGNGDVGGVGLEKLTGEDISRFVARLIRTMTSPEERVLTGLEPRADQSRVTESIRDLSFAPSPADAPAFYDFNDLQIAFEHVWQEAIDEGILDLAEDAYHDIVELGGDPDHDGQASAHPIRVLRDEARAVLTSRRVVRDQSGGTIVRDHRGEVTVRDHRGETVIRDHRGETVRHPNGPGAPQPGSVVVPAHPADRLPEILAELEQRLKEEYAFTVYAANPKERSVNFGILLTYRQRWDPLAYQAGKLAKTITLAPKETQRYSKKTVIRRKRAEKEVENHLRTRREEASQTTRAEQEIIRKATTKTNFSLVSKGSLNIPLGDGASVGGDVTTTFEREASKSSDDVKKSFHEAVFKAAQEYKDEQTTEVNTEEIEEVETVESGEITNPNDEIAVTFLFYELQRRYRVSERIYRITPVIFVAQEMPRPDEIDEDWLLTYDWILRRVLLDDSLMPALNYLSQNLVGEQVALEELRENIAAQRSIVEELRRELGVVRERMLSYRNLLERSLLTKAVEKSGGGGGGLLSSIPVVGDVAEEVVETIEGVATGVGEFLFGAPDGSGQSRQDALKEAIEKAADEERDLLFRLEREVTALNALTESYAKALAEFLNHKTQVARLRVHIKQNILYYMQAIWSHEPPDQRFFRLHKVPVPTLEAAKKTYIFPNLTPVTSSLASVAHRRLGLHGASPLNLYGADVKIEVEPKLEFTTLAQAAELDNLLGFKGNYMIFPLRNSNALTDFMMDPYVVAGLDELADPDDLGNWTLDEFAEYVCCLKETLTAQQFKKIKSQLVEQYRRLLVEPRRNGDVVTVPTNSLFIEALPAEHSLIEEFKAEHRVIDVKSAQADTRSKELENVRLAARLLSKPQLLEDPTIERKIVVEKDGGTIIVPADQ
jgi:hypothetical protein